MTTTHKEFPLYILIPIVIGLFAWAVTFGLFIWKTHAASLTSVSDTLTDTNLGAASNHTISYVNATTTDAGETIRVTFDPTTDLFNGVQDLVLGDVSTTGMTLTAACSGAASEVTLTTSSAAGDESLVLTVCATDTVSTGTKTIFIGNNKITNPTTTESYIIRIAGTQPNNADTRVAILSAVTLTASVDTSFSFTVSGLATSSNVNGVTTTRASTATALNFGTLPVGNPVTMGQQLNVTTNAVNGFVVTVVEDQNPTSLSGADIDLFANGNNTSTPSAWVAPSNTLNNENTYGHIGLTSDDADLNSDEFGTALFAGNFQSTSSRQVFSATGTSDGTTANIGSSTVAYRIQIASLQEAAALYTNELTYVATPTF